MSIRLIVADDHPLILDALEHLFHLEPDIEVVARCLNGEQTLQAVRHHQPDLVILDLRMPGTDGLAVLRQFRQEQVPARIVLLTAAVDENEVVEAIRLGVHGVVLKEMAPQLLVHCVRKVHAGGQWLEHRTVGRALDQLLRREAAARELAGVLTPREHEVVRYVARGLPNKAIATQLFISEGTVKVHLHSIYDKLQCEGRLALLRYAQEKGLV
jgi:DNA-binding NarL/FixJ family response regulator